MVSAEDVVAMERLAQMETLVQTQRAEIAALTTVAQQHQSAAVGGTSWSLGASSN